MSSNSESNKRIAKNTLLLYIRMIFLMCIQLYTSRIILKSLGVDDFGIYNVVGGIVSMFAFLNVSLSSCTQRYITFYLGKGDVKEIQQVFSHCVFIHAIIAFSVVVLSETIGLWFLYNKMVIPDSRMYAALWVYQLSILTSVVLIFSYPYIATIIAHEKISAFAYISIFDSSMKLLVATMLVYSQFDNLILYSILCFISQLIVQLLYILYCKKYFNSTVIHYEIKYDLFKEMFSFIGWNLWGGLSNIFCTQGLNILLNIIFGPAVNAARALAVQVQVVVQQFATNLQTAINPQITKSYASNDLKMMHNLIYNSTRYTFFLLMTATLPLFLEADFILNVWLSNVPEWTVSFVRIMILIIFLDSLSGPLMISSAATGNVKLYQIVIGGVKLFIVPISYVVLKLGYSPTSVFVVNFMFCIITFILRLLIIRPLVNLSIRSYLYEALVPCIKVGVSGIAISLLFYFNLDNKIIILFIIVLSSVIFIYLLGLTYEERRLVLNKINNLKLIRK